MSTGVRERVEADARLGALHGLHATIEEDRTDPMQFRRDGGFSSSMAAAKPSSCANRQRVSFVVSTIPATRHDLVNDQRRHRNRTAQGSSHERSRMLPPP